MSRLYKIAALAIAAAAVVVLAYAILSPEEPADSDDHMGMWGMRTYSTQNVSVMVVSVIVIVAALSFALLWNRYEPLPPTMAPPPTHAQADQQHGTVAMMSAPDKEDGADADSIAAHNYLVLRLLSGDERTMYKALMDSGGEALQKDLILRTKMSNAKVSRVLDRLAEKDIIVKERYGATNKVRIKVDR